MIVNLGNWLFRHRNFMFPIFYAALFLPSSSIFISVKWSFIGGSILIALGICIRGMTIGLVYIVRGGKNRTIFADKLVTEGVYRICRNPMYLGNVILLLGFSFFSDSLFFLVLFFPLFCLFYVAIIKAEEVYLLNKFKDQYLAYLNSTRAMMPSFKHLKSTLTDCRFNLKKVIIKEYNSWFLYISGIELLLLYKDFLSIQGFLVLFMPFLFLYLVVKVLKFRNWKSQRPDHI